MYYRQRKLGMLTIEPHRLVLHTFPEKILYLNYLKEIRYAAGDYCFRDINNREIIIAKESIDKNQITEFQKRFDGLKEKLEGETQKPN